MWDNPRMMTLTANILYVIAVLLVVGAGTYELVRSPAFPLRIIRIEGELSRVERAQIVEALQGRLQGTFFTADLELVRQRFETVPWVRRAVVRRSWPDRLDVRIEEHVELARWGNSEDRQLINVHGEIFTAISDRDLPIFSGPPGSEREVTRGYAEFGAALKPLALAPRQVLLNERRSWQVKLDSGLVLKLGRDLPKDSVRDRLARFIEIYPRTLGQMKRRLDYVDLRYPNGFVLRVPGLQRAEESRAAKPKA